MSSHIANQLRDRYFAQTNGGHILALVLHGSAIRAGSDAFSDVDLLVITDQSVPAFHALWHVDQTPCDLHLTGLPELLAQTRKDVPSNNNFALRAFATGTILFEAEPAIPGLQREALNRWKAGPLAPSPTQLHAIRQAAIQTELFLDKCAVRTTFDPIWTEIQAARSGIFLGQLVDSYCRLENLWSNAWWILIHEANSEYQPIIDLIRCFLTSSQEAKIDTLHILCDKIIAMANQRFDEMRTPLDRALHRHPPPSGEPILLL